MAGWRSLTKDACTPNEEVTQAMPDELVDAILAAASTSTHFPRC
jgi:hypothetical protein